MKIVVIDYQLGNISSIINMLKKIGVEAIHSNARVEIENADKFILPGIGSFDHGMRNLESSGLIPLLNEEVLVKKKPILGICLGMQLLLNKSEEGALNGLGWIKGKCQRFHFQNANSHLKVPHMGWNTVYLSENNNWKIDSETDSRYYFVHSYHAICEDQQNVIGTTCYGYNFPSVIGNEHILGAQFHPEKSHKYGMKFLKNFVEYESC